MTGTEDFTPEETAALGEMQEAVTTNGPAPDAGPEVVSEPAAEPAKGPERGPDGKFLSKAVETPAVDASSESEAAPTEEPAKPEAVKPPEGFVPHGAMHQEREARKAAEQRAQAAEARIAAFEAERAEAAEPAPEPWPDPIADPDGYNARMQKELASRDEKLEQFQRQTQQEQQRSYVVNTLAAQSQRMERENPDFTPAVNHAIAAYKTELTLMNPGASEDQIMQRINADIEQLAFNAMQIGKNPAEVIFEIAKARGYRPAAVAAPAAAAPAVDEGRKVEALAAAQKATESLGAAPVASGANELTLESLAKMSEADIARLQRERPKDVARALGA